MLPLTHLLTVNKSRDLRNGITRSLAPGTHDATTCVRDCQCVCVGVGGWGGSDRRLQCLSAEIRCLWETICSRATPSSWGSGWGGGGVWGGGALLVFGEGAQQLDTVLSQYRDQRRGPLEIHQSRVLFPDVWGPERSCWFLKLFAAVFFFFFLSPGCGQSNGAEGRSRWIYDAAAGVDGWEKMLLRSRSPVIGLEHNVAPPWHAADRLASWGE